MKPKTPHLDAITHMQGGEPEQTTPDQLTDIARREELRRNWPGESISTRYMSAELLDFLDRTVDGPTPAPANDGAQRVTREAHAVVKDHQDPDEPMGPPTLEEAADVARREEESKNRKPEFFPNIKKAMPELYALLDKLTF